MVSAEERLDIMLQDMEKAEALYRPTNFWSSGLESIVQDLKKRGFSNFREQPSAAFFYVPNYAGGIWRKHGKKLVPLLKFLDSFSRKKIGPSVSHIFNGERLARCDHRILVAADVEDGFNLSHLSESEIGGGERFRFEGNNYSKSFLNYCRGLALLKKKQKIEPPISVLEIGGGYGTLGEVLLKSSDDSFYINIDIPPVAAVSSYYLIELFGEESVLTYEKAREMETIDIDVIKKDFRCAILCSWQLPKVRNTVDLFVNFISFQEMEPDIVKNYVRLVQPLTSKYVLLRNSKYGKNIAHKEGEIGVLEPTGTDDIIGYFDQFDLLARDSYAFGDVSRHNDFVSEVIIMKRKSRLNK